MDLPPILLEGDEPSIAPTSLPAAPQAELGGQKAWTRATPPEIDSLPEAYGTGKLYLLARDPDCIYAHWDLSLEQQHQYNALSRDRHLVLRVFIHRKSGAPFREIHLHPESQSWFVYVDRAGSAYVAELGYYARGGEWMNIADSDPISTLTVAASPDQQVQFATVQTTDLAPAQVVRGHPTPYAAAPTVLTEFVPASLPPSKQPAPAPATFSGVQVQPAPGSEREPWTERVAASVPTVLIMHQEAESPSDSAGEVEWTELHERALDRIVMATQVCETTSSLENIQIVQKVLEKELASISAAQRVQPQPGAVPVQVSSLDMSQPQVVSSEFGQVPLSERQFWLMVNAELVIYGATDPSASVTIGERRIRLRPDGTFTYRFALPDGNYELPITAASVDDERRHVALSFSRNTVSHGEVGKHPQDPALRPPAVENLS
jgi:hypothetical protein